MSASDASSDELEVLDDPGDEEFVDGADFDETEEDDELELADAELPTDDDDDDTVVEVDAEIVALPTEEEDDEDEDEDVLVRVVEDDDEDLEPEGLKEGEFICTSCYLAKGPTQLADARKNVCVDCV